MKKIIMDTSALIYDPDIIFKAKGEVYIPYGVLRELDGLKDSQNNTVAATARHLIRKLYVIWMNGFEYKTKNSIIRPINIEPNKSVDLYLIDLAIKYDAILVTMDINLYLEAKIRGADAMIYKGSGIELFKGYIEIEAPNDFLEKIYRKEPVYWKHELFPNTYIRFYNGERQALMRYIDKNHPLHRVNNKNRKIMGIHPLNPQQYFLLDAILDPKVNLITVTGPAGTGKSLVTLAASLEAVINLGLYKDIKINKAPIPVGKDHGYLPGSITEKLEPWLYPFFDALSYLETKSRTIRDIGLDNIINKNITFEAVTYIRGRSFRDSIIIIEEAQNRALSELKTIITRAGDNCKIILLGDIDQIDNFYLNKYNNGLTQVAHKFKNQKIAAHLMLEQGIRSELATIASKIL